MEIKPKILKTPKIIPDARKEWRRIEKALEKADPVLREIPIRHYKKETKKLTKIYTKNLQIHEVIKTIFKMNRIQFFLLPTYSLMVGYSSDFFQKGIVLIAISPAKKLKSILES